MTVYTTLANWKFKKHSDSTWIPLKTPLKTTTEIHVDLIDNGLIPDPFVDMNEKDVQWVGEVDWDYKSEFEIAKNTDLSTLKFIKFNGLDTFATVFLNETKIFESENMFVIEQLEIPAGLLKIGSNELKIHFRSALLEARKILKEQYGGYLPVGFNGEGNRNYIRKAQYHYGWDWGPILMTCGPYRPIEVVQVDPVHISNYFLHYHFSNDLSKLKAFLKLDSEGAPGAKVSINLKDPQGELAFCKEASLPLEKSVEFELDKPSLWFPNTYGAQNLYQLQIKDSTSNKTLISKNVGFRKLELVQDPLKGKDQVGKTFHFRVNGIPTYCSGVNWIPAHSFQTKLTDSDYKAWLDAALEGNFNMVRIWGGGYYEQDRFYELCDELGLLVWHDFMFACGQYPGDSKFVANVEKEVKSQILRLRNHCSMALWCGNNEDYQVLEQSNLDQSFTTQLNSKSFPARSLYEKHLPNWVSKYYLDSGLVPYHPGSPWGDGIDTTDRTVGDLHQWNVWHGTQERYQDWDKLEGRFVSEFGMLLFANDKFTLEPVVTDKTELYPQSETVCFHNKAAGAETRIAKYISENFKLGDSSLAGWCYLTQLMQSDCLVALVRIWKRHWLASDRLQSGYIVWQLNDCWPVNSWAIMDFNKIPKLSYYALKRENSALTVGVKRLKFAVDDAEKLWHKDLNDEEHQYVDFQLGLELWCCNLSLASHSGCKLRVRLIDIPDGELLEQYELSVDQIAPNQSTNIANKVRFGSKTCLVYLQLVDSEGKQLYRVVDWPDPLKYLKFASRDEAKIQLKVNYDLGQVTVSSEKPVKGLEIYSDTKLFQYQDNGIDLVPGEEISVGVKGLSAGDELKYRYYDM